MAFAIILAFPAGAYAASALSYGSRGLEVRDAQKQLIARGLLSSDSATGFFGAATRAAVQEFQKQNGIVSSGSELTTGFGAIGPKTRLALFAQPVTKSTTENDISLLQSQLQSLLDRLSQLRGGYSSTASISRSVTPEKSCQFNGKTLVHNARITAYQFPSPINGRCVSEERTCIDGTLTGTFTNEACTPVPVPTAVRITVNKSTFVSGEKVVAEFQIPESPGLERNPYDWIGIYKKNGTLAVTRTDLIEWMYLSGTKTAPPAIVNTGTIDLDTTNLTGTFEIRLLKAASYDFLADASAQITVLTAPSATIDTAVVYAGPKHDAFPSAARLQNGHILIAFRSAGKHTESGGVGVLMESPDNGVTWSSPRIAFERSGYDFAPGSDLAVLSGGRAIFLNHEQQSSSNNFATFPYYSDDNGSTWQKASALTPYSYPYGRIIETGDGGMIAPIVGFDAGGGGQFISRDGGSTWKLGPTIFKITPTNIFTETAVISLEGNRYMAIGRSNASSTMSNYQNSLYQSFSSDGGATWSSPQYLFEGASPDLLNLNNGHILLCAADRDPSDGASGVRCHISDDNGMTWKPGKMIYTAPNIELADPDATTYDHGYPSSLQLADGRIFTVYYFDSNGTTAGVDIARAIYPESVLR